MKLPILLTLFLLTSWAYCQDSNVDSLKNVLVSAEGKDRIKTLIELCWEYRFSNADTARAYGLEALAMARQTDDLTLEVDALHNIGVTHEAQGNYTEALKFEMDALALRQQIGDDVKTANTLNNIGIIYDEKGDYQTAFEYYYRAHSIYEKAGDKAKIAMVSVNMGIVLKAQSDYRQQPIIIAAQSKFTTSSETVSELPQATQTLVRCTITCQSMIVHFTIHCWLPANSRNRTSHNFCQRQFVTQAWHITSLDERLKRKHTCYDPLI